MSLEGYRLAFGIAILVLVDIVSVTIPRLTEFVFDDDIRQVNPFLVSVINATTLTIYLIGFLVWKPWRDLCTGCSRTLRSTESTRNEHIYAALSQSEPDDNVLADGNSFSESSFIPINVSGFTSEHSDNADSDGEEKKFRVRFSRLTEVRHLADSQAEDALLARLSYQASLRAEEEALRAASRLSAKDTFTLAFKFSFLWFFGGLTYWVATSRTGHPPGQLYYSSSSFLAIVLGCVFPSTSRSDAPSLTKGIVIVAALTVAGLSCAQSWPNASVPMQAGMLWSLVSAVLFASSVIVLRHHVDSDDKLDMPMFLGFVGLILTVTMLPALLALHLSKISILQLPNRNQWTQLLVNGFVTNALTNLLWLWGCLLTSSVLTTLSGSLIVPLTLLMDTVLNESNLSQLFLIESLPPFVALVIVTTLTLCDCDPISSLFLRLMRKLSRSSNSFVREENANLRESLLENEDA